MSMFRSFSALLPVATVRWSVLILCLGFLAGCSNSDQDFIFTSSSASAGTGNVAVLHPRAGATGRGVAARQVKLGDSITRVTTSGLDSSGNVVYGPIDETHLFRQLLPGVPVAVTRLTMVYRRADGSEAATGQADVRVVPGTTVTVTATVEKSLAVQIVNDSEVADDEVYLLLSANGTVDLDLEGGKLAIFPIGTGSTDVVSTKLTDLKAVGTRISPLTGLSRNVYEFLPKQVVSGRLWVSYGAPLTYKQGDNSPGSFENVRYDKIELGYNPSSGNTTGFFDLTSVDFFGIPLQLEVLADPSDEYPLRTASFYTSTPTLLKTLNDLAPSTMNQAFYQKGTSAAEKGWSSSTDTLATFLRVMSPSTLVSVVQPSGAPFTAAPYPSFRNYLATIANKGEVVTLSGSNGVDGGALTNWRYQASVVSDGNDGFLIKCLPTATMSNAPQGSLGDPNYPVNPSLPKDLEVDIAIAADNLDEFIYGVPANAFSIKNLDAYLIPYAANSVYANIGGNYLAGLNLGYVDGKYGDDSTYWYELLPGYPPYGAARTAPDDGYYNPYAAVLYNLSDSYSFSISDRLQIGNPLVTTTPSSPYLRVTLLPDVRLDAPANLQVTSGESSENVSLTASWDAVTAPAGFSNVGYTVSATDGSVQVVSPDVTQVPTPTENVFTVDTTDTTATLTGLEPGTAYKVTVVATGVYQGRPVRSVVGQFAIASTPQAAPPTSNDTIRFLVGLAPPANLDPGISFKLDGQTLSQSSAVALTRPKPSNAGQIVRALLQTFIANPVPGGEPLLLGQTTLLFNVFADGDDKFNPYFNFPFSSQVPGSGVGSQTLLDGSSLNFAYNTSGSEPPFGDSANSLSVNVLPNPVSAPKTVAAARFPDAAEVPVQTPGPTIPPPAYVPATHTPVPSTPFKVQAVLGSNSPVADLASLEGASVRFVRLVTYPTNGPDGIAIPGADGGGFDAAGTLDKNGSAVFDPSQLPYSAPIWNLGYRVDVVVNGVTYSGYGSWRTPAVGSEWKSGLSGLPDAPGTIYVPVYPNPSGQVVWGN